VADNSRRKQVDMVAELKVAMSRCAVSALTVAIVTWSALMMTSRTAAESQAKKLYDELLMKSNYKKLIRPVDNTSESLTVHIGLRLTSIIDVVSRSAFIGFTCGGRSHSSDIQQSCKYSHS